MRRVFSTFPVFMLFLLSAVGCQAQQPDPPAYIYEAYYQVDFGDMTEWNRLFAEYAAPVLNDLQEQGVIQGWSQWEHQTGGSDYNVRFTARTWNWQALADFWDQYLSNLNANTPAAESQAIGRMIQAHYDEIWDVSTLNVPEGLSPSYMYASTYRYSFADGEEWHRLWNEVAGPIVDQAVQDGLLGGWATLNHNTGGAHNYKVLYLFEDWDQIDDFFDKVLGTLSTEHAADFEAFENLVMAHDDAIWVPAMPEAM